MTDRRSYILIALVGCATVLCAASVRAQLAAGFAGDGGSHAPIQPNIKYDGRFTFVRLRYGPPIRYQSQLVPWSHDYPEGEHNLMKILTEISFLGPHVEETNVMAFDDPALFRYPLAYLSEPGAWSVTDKEATTFRAYLQKGGFFIVDDFRFSCHLRHY